jgi:hypothetical protein
MASGETIIKHTAKSTYEGMIATLNNAHCALGFDRATGTSRCQNSTTGAAEMLHTTIWTATRDAIVQAMRQIITARDGAIRESTGVMDASNA